MPKRPRADPYRMPCRSYMILQTVVMSLKVSSMQTLLYQLGMCFNHPQLAGLPKGGGGNWANLPRGPCMRGGPQPKMGLKYLVLQQFFPSPIRITLFRCIIPSHYLLAYSLAIMPTIGASLFGFALGLQNPLSGPASIWK